ncbi:hypothetical protein MBLNU13_g06097t1 [Cladosporium sp. NU13]
MKRAGAVRHVVYLSACGDFVGGVGLETLMRTQPTMHVIVKATIEQRLKYGDYPWTHTVLGPTLFFFNNLRAKESMLKEDLFDEPLGKDGVSRISVPDIALAARNTLLNLTRRNSVIVSNGNIIALQLPHPSHPEDGHTDAVYSIYLQGDHLVSVSADHTVRVWDLRTQRTLYPPLIGHTGSVTSLQCDAAAHNDVIITGGIDGNVMIWQFSTGAAIKAITKAHKRTILSLNFDERYLVTGGMDKQIKLWNRKPMDADHANVPPFAIKPTESDRYQEYSLFATFDGHDAAVNAVKLQDNILISGSGDRTMCIWSLQTGQILQKIKIHQRGIACLQFNGRFIVSGSTDETVRIYDTNQEMEIACLKGHTNLVRSVQAVFDPDGEVKTVISGGYDGNVRIWEQEPGAREWRTQHQFQLNGFEASGDLHPGEDADRFSNRIFSVGFDTSRFVCSGQGPIIRVWDLRSSNK